MNEPIRFQSGEPLSAASLNNALDYSRPQHAEVPNEGNAFFGSKSANGRSSVERERMILVRAVEDFAVRATVCEFDDDVPSGLVEYVRLIPQLNVHLPPDNQSRFYAYDPIAGLNNESDSDSVSGSSSGSASESGESTNSKSEGDVFHCGWNDDSGRWEVIGGVFPTEIAVVLDAALAVATQSKTGASFALARVCEWGVSTNEYVETQRQVTVWNHSETTAYAIDTFGFARMIQGHLVFMGDCDSMAVPSRTALV